MNLLDAIDAGIAGKNQGLNFGMSKLNTALGGMQKKESFTWAAEPKVGKCLAKDTLVRMFDGTLKKVQDIQVGDKLRGTDLIPRKVLTLGKGIEKMYKIHQKCGNSYTVNESHILSLFYRDKYTSKYSIKDISVKDFIQLNKTQKRFYFGWIPRYVNYAEKKYEISPYMVGLYIGDGSRCKPCITNIDDEIINFLQNFDETYRVRRENITYCFTTKGVLVFKHNITGEELRFESWKSANEYFGTNMNWGQRVTFKDYSVLSQFPNNLAKLAKLFTDEKFIPSEYLIGSYEQRLALLAGIIDTDGYYEKQKGFYEVTTKYEKLMQNIFELSRSLGFKIHRSIKIVNGTTYYRMIINPGNTLIPCLIKRKQNSETLLKTPVNFDRIEIEPLGEDEYYGFEIDGDKRFLLADYTVTHNTAYVDKLCVINPYMYSPSIKKKFIYYSFEIDRISKEAKYAAHFMSHDYGIEISDSYILGKTKNESGDRVIVTEEHREKLVEIYSRRIIPLFGEYVKSGNSYKRVKEGMIDFIEQRENPTGIRNYLLSYAAKHGKLIYEPFLTLEGGQEVQKQRLIGYEPFDPELHTVVIIDHIRGMARERGFDMKQNIDKMSEYHVELRNTFGFTFHFVVHLRRGLTDVDRLKFMKDSIFPTSEDIKDSGNLAEDCTHVFTIFNPADDKYNLKTHFGVNFMQYNGMYRTLHLVDSRYASCPQHWGTLFDGKNIRIKEV